MKRLLSFWLILLQLIFLNCAKGPGTFSGPKDLREGELGDELSFDPSSIPSGTEIPEDLEPAIPKIGEENKQISVPGDPAIPAAQRPQFTSLVGKLRNPSLSAEQKSKVMQQLAALAAQQLQACLASIGSYKPLPGEPLTGYWTGSKCNVGFVLQGATSGTLLAVSTTSKEVCTGQAASDGSVTAQSCSMGSRGTLTDQPSAGIGKVNTQDGCSTDVALVTSTNKIPEKFQAAMKKVGECYRMALVLQSPILTNPAMVGVVPYFLGIK